MSLPADRVVSSHKTVRCLCFAVRWSLRALRSYSNCVAMEAVDVSVHGAVSAYVPPPGAGIGPGATPPSETQQSPISFVSLQDAALTARGARDGAMPSTASMIREQKQSAYAEILKNP